MFVFKVFLLLYAINSLQASSWDADSFFGVRGNLTLIQWAHAVNNQSALAAALDSDIMMIEADVTIGNLTLNSLPSLPSLNPIEKFRVPVMSNSHPALSDLSLKMFLSEICIYNNRTSTIVRKGAKLDFKTMEAFEVSIPIINDFYKRIDFPVWLSANIITGPQAGSTPVIDPKSFLRAANNFTDWTISLGWTSEYTINSVLSYRHAQITAMITVSKSFKIFKNVTFCVRAAIAASSIKQIQTLMSSVNWSTLTIWSVDTDRVNVSNLRKLIVNIGVNRTFLDVPNSLRNELDLPASSGLCRTNDLMMYIMFFCLIYM